MDHIEIMLFFFLIAAVYSSVGFGGGSSYLAILALFGFPYMEVRSTALLCNIVVVSGGVLIFLKRGHLDLRRSLPLVLVSVPMAFLGGLLRIGERSFFILLGVSLLLAAVFMWVQKIRSEHLEKRSRPWMGLLVGSGIGLLAGMVGIGGGIFLAPVLHLMAWDTSKKIAATASLFILLNSLSGLSGQMLNPDFFINWNLAFGLMLAVFGGGQIGSRLGAGLISPLALKRVTSLLVIFVGIRLLIKYLPA